MPHERKAAIVTGASRGIGAAIATRLAADGYAIAVNYAHDRSGAQRTVESILETGGAARSFQADISRESDVIDLFNAADAQFGTVSVLVNNGGVTGGFSRVDELSAESLTHVFAVNVIGAFLCAREAVRRMSVRHDGGGGSIVNISSRAGDLGGSGEWVHYAATKGALDTLTKGLAKEIALEGVRVNAVAAGLIETDLHAAAGKPDRTAKMASSIPIGRAGLPDEIAECVSWLVSPAAAYITGAIVPVSGGR
ncbi:glucose 1-dehydrogenase [Paraburkholderia phenazinium]|uniref:NAD(P)-dependent dehydrogenase, short-chain alcohol dehydrogenase family n=1 Tax=Paraburkholderia phenazinium TaxID=60549 RepID=A0A1G7U2N7_9BURK|nr:glucose 1-dehydrogenase [Paraburkholderia phenazinium]SDG41654.1 NAD(P)-dependent dehydrogenase, short-chain alcohol dehydrogenase family [Paraburkholderia phenazinium]